MDLISVIVPVYNVEPYLRKCLDSILAQTYTNLEIIVVDDGSTDGSGRICDEYAAKDARIRVIHKANGGLSDARNAGMAVAKGSYIGFVDSDDYVAPKMYEMLYLFAVKNELDVAMCCAYEVYGDRILGNNKQFNPIILNDREKIVELILIPHGAGVQINVWTKLYKKDVVAPIHFKTGKSYEDVFWTLDWIAQTERFGWFSDTFYYYVQRVGSITHEPRFKPTILDEVEGHEENYKHILQHYPKALDAGRYRLAWSYCMCIGRIAECADWQEHRAEMELVRSKALVHLGELLASPSITMKMKISLLLLAADLDLYLAVKKLYKRLKERKKATCTPPLY